MNELYIKLEHAGETEVNKGLLTQWMSIEANEIVIAQINRGFSLNEVCHIGTVVCGG